jgi:mRNA interferase RelE/StbE
MKELTTMRKLRFTKQALAFVDQLDAKQYRQVGRAIFGLTADAEPSDSQVLKNAKHGERRIDVGEYRIIYLATSDEVEVIVIGKRNDDEVYRIWKRME